MSPHPRDLRLDFFRGLALVFIFIDHTPGNRLTSWTIRNFGLSDASELFVFISAYTAGLVHMNRVLREGLTGAGQRIWRRATQIYLAHLLVLVVTCVLAGWLTRAFDNPQFVQGLNVAPFLDRPLRTFIEALLLLFQPTFMNILPLYVVLFLALPGVLRLLRRRPGLTLALSIGLYVVARESAWLDNPFGVTWQFNPLAWQLLFVAGVTLGSMTTAGRPVPRSPALLVAAAAYLVWGYWNSTAAWTYDGSSLSLPRVLAALLFPVMDRPNLSLWRLLHVLALAYVTVYFVSAQSRFLRQPLARPFVLLGQHSLTLFCIGIVLSVLGWAVFTELGVGAAVQVLVNGGGFTAMWLVAWLLSPPPAVPPASPPGPRAAALTGD